MRFSSRNRRLDRAEIATATIAVVLSTGFYVRYRHPYLARGVVGDLVGLAICSVPLAARRRRFRHEALVCLAGIGAVSAASPRWPLRIADAVWWAAIGIGLALYGAVRHRRLCADRPPSTAHVLRR